MDLPTLKGKYFLAWSVFIPDGKVSFIVRINGTFAGFTCIDPSEHLLEKNDVVSMLCALIKHAD